METIKNGALRELQNFWGDIHKWMSENYEKVVSTSRGT